ncbi:hypothetical protein [Microvirga sp. TS319]|uniref:hypothetical protein n=1 Tax=Microvirga sp. TS319 TaxID=3241165 RepID=UPI003519F87D
MTEEEIEAVAEELAKIGGIAWYPGRTNGPLLRPVGERYRSRARAAISALDRIRAMPKGSAIERGSSSSDAAVIQPEANETDELFVGAIVMYRPPADQRAVPCRVEKLEGGRAYLVPCPKPDFGWISLEDLLPSQ